MKSAIEEFKKFGVEGISPLMGNRNLEVLIKRKKAKLQIIEQFENGIKKVLYTDNQNRYIALLYEL